MKPHGLYVLVRQRAAERIWNLAHRLYYYWPQDLDDDPEKRPWWEVTIAFQATAKAADDTMTRMVDSVCPSDHHTLAPCDFRFGGMRMIPAAEVTGEAEPPPSILTSDFVALGEAFIELYLQGLNGVICDPAQEAIGRLNCRSCHDAWAKGTNVLKKYDPRWGNMYRSGGSFQPGDASDG